MNRPLAWLALMAALVACGERRVDPPLNILLISLDTTRADRLGAYGHAGAGTENIDALARSGVLFEQCSSPTPLTAPSHASLMTGVYPFVHGVRDNGGYVLSPDSVTLAEVLATSGYATGAQVGVFVLNRGTGLEQGFATYRDTGEATDSEATAVPLSRRSTNELRAEEVAAGALAWLRQRGADRPFFFFAHFFDPHAPYEPPAPFTPSPRGPAQSSPASRYQGEIAYVDQQVGRLLRELDNLGVADRTLVILTADHGEAFGEHSELGHSYFVYDTTTRVPLIMRLPGVLPAGSRVATQVRLIDIAPTILDLAGLPPLPRAQGVSLRPTIEGHGGDLPAYLETLAPFTDYRYSPLRGLRDGDWKYILAPREELYELAVDPGEIDNLAARHPDRVAAMRRSLRRLVEQAPIGTAGPAPAVDSARASRLESLGYLGRSGGDADELPGLEPRGPDPKDRIEEMSLAAVGLRAFHDRDFERAERIYRRLLENDRGNVRFLDRLAATLLATGETQAAIEIYGKASEVDPGYEPDRPDALLLLARRDAVLGDAGSAATRLEAAVRTTPPFPEALAALAWLRSTHPQPAVRDGRRALEAARRFGDLSSVDDPLALLVLATALAETGEQEAAVVAATRAGERARSAGRSNLADRAALVEATLRLGRPYRTAEPL